MLTVGQKVKLRDKNQVPKYFSEEGEVIKVHQKDDKVGWIQFELIGYGSHYILNLHEKELIV